jgi:hypothetical protein
LTLPTAAVAIYETLRTEVLAGRARPDGLGAVVYHGLIGGLPLLSQSLAVQMTPAAAAAQSLPNVRTDPQLLHLLANMVLQTHQEMAHVY